MKVAVIGANGFVGRHVLRALKSTNVEVMAVSRRPMGDALPSGMHQVQIDLTSPPPDCFALLGRPEVVMHLAWSDLRNWSSRQHFEAQLPQHYRFLHDLIKAGLSSLMCTGTCFEYGMRSGELHEDQCPDPANAYGFAKDALRRELQFLAKDHPFQLTWARLFYMYGDGQPTTSLFGQFKAAVANGDTRFPMSSGEQLRDYMDVSDVAQQLVQLALRAPDSGIVNVCSGRPTSVRALVDRWAAAESLPPALTLGHYPYPSHEPMAFWGSNAKLSRLLGAKTISVQ
jgi:nucleoside-diphosphate-sugar epimerase